MYHGRQCCPLRVATLSSTSGPSRPALSYASTTVTAVSKPKEKEAKPQLSLGQWFYRWFFDVDELEGLQNPPVNQEEREAFLNRVQMYFAKPHQKPDLQFCKEYRELRSPASLIGGEREWAPYLDVVNGSHVCTCIRTWPLIMHMSGTYSSCDSYACTCTHSCCNCYTRMYTKQEETSWYIML